MTSTVNDSYETVEWASSPALSGWQVPGIAPYHPRTELTVAASHWDDRQLTPPNQPIAVPAYLGGEFAPDWAKIPARTPKDEIRTARNDKTGAIMYKYVTSGYVFRVLDRVFQGHNWGYEIVREERTHEDASGKYEYVVVLQIVGPGMFRPVIGVGSSVYHPTNPQDTDAKTRAGAFTGALKNAAKQMGIGRDLDEDDPEFVKLVDGRLNSIALMFKRLTELGHGEAAKAVVRKIAPTALLETGELLSTSIDFEELEPLQRELQAVANRVAQERVKAQ